MQILMQAYYKELAEISGFAPDTVENHEICVRKYFDFATNQLKIDPLAAGARDLLQWMRHLKEQNLSRSRLTHHKAALKYLFGLHLNAEMLQVLSEWLAVRHNFKNSGFSDALFISKKGNRLAIRTMEVNMRKLIDRLGLKVHFNVTCHTLRHYAEYRIMPSQVEKISCNFHPF